MAVGDGMLFGVSAPSQLPREFRMPSGEFGRKVMVFGVEHVLVFLFALTVGWAVFGGAAGGILLALIWTGALVGIQYRKFLRMRQGTLVRFSEYGVELRDNLGFHARLGWRDITQVGQIQTQLDSSGGIVFDSGIVGWGEWMVPENAPDWIRARLAQARVNPDDGRREVAIPLGRFDRNWTSGPMGQWVRTYRPDLLS